MNIMKRGMERKGGGLKGKIRTRTLFGFAMRMMMLKEGKGSAKLGNRGD